MGVTKQIYCDLCGRIVEGNYLVLRGVYHKFDYIFHDALRKKIIICGRCINSLQSAAEEDRKLERREE